MPQTGSTPRAPRPAMLRSAAIALLLLLTLAPTASALRPEPLAGDDSTPSTAPATPLDPDSRPLGPNRPPASSPKSHSSTATTAEPPSAGLLRTILSLGFVIALAMLTAAIVKRLGRGKGSLAAAFGPGGPAPSGVLEILGRYPLTRGQTLILLRVQGRILLLASSGGFRLGRGGVAGLNTLCELADAEEVASIITAVRDADGDSLSARFRSMLSRHSTPADAEADAADPDHADTATPGRRCIAVSPHGDRAELWDDQPRQLHLVGEEPAAPAQPLDAVTSLQRRLDAFRGSSGGRA